MNSHRAIGDLFYLPHSWVYTRMNDIATRPLFKISISFDTALQSMLTGLKDSKMYHCGSIHILTSELWQLLKDVSPYLSPIH